MVSVLVLVAADAQALPAAQDRVADSLSEGVWMRLGPVAAEAAVDTPDPAALKQVLDARLADLPVDYAMTPSGPNRRKRLLLADMDSTIIGCECLDELADFA